MRLEVGRITCIEESDEIGSDDIYLAVFIARENQRTGLNVVGPGPAWRNFDTGESRGQDILLDGKADFGTTYFVAMIECDNAKDLTGSSRNKLRNSLKANYSSFQNDLNRFRREATRSLNRILDNDDVIKQRGGWIPAFKTLRLAPQRRSKWITYKGDGAEYRVKFKMMS